MNHVTKMAKRSSWDFEAGLTTSLSAQAVNPSLWGEPPVGKTDRAVHCVGSRGRGFLFSRGSLGDGGRFVGKCLRLCGAILGLASVVAANVPWREGYRMYLPRVQVHTVYTGQSHDASIVFFDGNWFALWDSGTEQDGQVIWQSKSFDLVNWSEPIQAFSSEAGSFNPIPATTTVRQWQPGLLVVGNELWCLWSSTVKGVYFSRLSSSKGKWSSKLLFKNTDIVFDNTTWIPFIANNGIRSSSGQIIFPITLRQTGTIWTGEKRDSVLYTNDGIQWRVSPGGSYGPNNNQAWEATVWEPAPGQINLIARNNRPASPADPLPPDENLKFSRASLSNLDSWTPHTLLPLETAMSRPHVMHGGARNYLVQNDSHIVSSTSIKSNRKNLSLFFNRGRGYDFVAGLTLYPETNFTIEAHPHTDYPQMAIDGDRGVVIFSHRTLNTANWSVKVAVVDPLPAAGARYVFPRTARGRIEPDTSNGRNWIWLCNNYSSAGIDIDENRVSADKALLSFRFKPKTPDRQTIVSFGAPAAVLVTEAGRLWLGKVGEPGSFIDCGPVSSTDWTSVVFESGVGTTSVRVNNAVTPREIAYSPEEGRALYFGLNYYAGAVETPGAQFVVDLDSVRTAVVEGVPPTVPVLRSASFDDSIRFSWDPTFDEGGSGLAGYEVDISTQAGFGGAVRDAGTMTSVNLEGLRGGTTYYARARAYDGVGNRSGWSPAVAQRVFGLTNPGFEETSANGAPGWKISGDTNVTVTNAPGEFHGGERGLKVVASPRTFPMAWQDWDRYTEGATYQLSFWGKVDSEEGLKGRVPVLTIPRDGSPSLIFAYVDVTEPEWRRYSMTFSTTTPSDGIRLRCYESTNTLKGTMYFDDFVITTVTVPLGVPGAPTGVGVTAEGDSLAVAWTPPAGSLVDSYRVFVSTESNFASHLEGWFNRDVGNMTTVNVRNLSDDTVYFVRTRAFNRKGGTSPYSPAASVRTPDISAPMVNLLSPAPGETFTEPQTIPVRANAADNVGVSKVWFLRNGAVVSTDTAAPYEHAWTFTGADNGAHQWSARAFDAMGNSSTTALVTVTVSVDVTPPGAPGSVTATGVAGDRVRLSWGASTDNVGVTAYLLERCAGAGCTNFASVGVLPVTGTVTGVNTTMFADRLTLTWSGGGPFKNVLKDQRVVIKDVGYSLMVNSVAGYLYLPRTATVAVGDSVAFGAPIGTEDGGLVTGTTYRYRVRARDAAGNLSNPSEIGAATTPDVAPPVVAIAAPLNGASVRGEAEVEVTATDNVGVTSVVFAVNGVVRSTDTAAPYVYAWDSSVETPNREHSLTARAYDAAGNNSLSSPVAVTVLDGAAPSAPPALTVTSIGTGRSRLAWDAATDNVGVTGYELERCVGAGCSNFVRIATLPVVGTVTKVDRTTFLDRVTLLWTGGDQFKQVAWKQKITVGVTTHTLTSDSTVGNLYLPVTAVVSVGDAVAFLDPLMTTDPALSFSTVHLYRIRARDGSGNVGPYSPVATLTTNETAMATELMKSEIPSPPTDVEGARAYPVPYRAGSGAGGITFDRLPEGTRIRIFTLGGRLVRELTTDGSGRALWTVDNDDGTRLASGVYVVVAENSGKRKAFKIIVQM